jgi:hypothetical protein
VDLEALVIALPAAGCLVDAALKRQRVLMVVMEDADLRVEDAPVPSPWYSDLDRESILSKQLREELELGVEPFVVEFVKALAELVGECFQNRTVGLVEFSADDESHLPIVFHECVDTASCNGEGTAREVSCYSVVANASFEGWNIEFINKMRTARRRLALVNRVPRIGLKVSH